MMKHQILIVDDSSTQGATRKAILSRAGADVVMTDDPAEVVRLIESPEFQASLALLITDHMMPAMPGPDLVRRVRTVLPELPILVISGLAEAETDYEGLSVSFHLKPFPPEELIRTARKHLPPSDVLRTA